MSDSAELSALKSFTFPARDIVSNASAEHVVSRTVSIEVVSFARVISSAMSVFSFTQSGRLLQ